MFFFFNDDEYKPGTVCLVTDPRRPGGKVVIDEIRGNLAWCYDNRPVKHRVNRHGKRVVEFDPACVLSLYRIDQLEITGDIPLQEDGWGAKYRRERLIIR